MKKNMGTLDIVIRLLVAVVFILLFAFKIVPMWLGIILLVLAAMFIVTSFIRYCPLYVPLRISTICRKKEEKNNPGQDAGK